MTARKVVQPNQRVCLAAAEVRLKLHDRVTALTAQPLSRVQQQIPQSLGEERTPEELLRPAVFVLRVTRPHLMQVGGELRLLVLARSNIAMRRNDIAPRLQVPARHPLERLTDLPSRDPPCFFLESPALQVVLHPPHFGRLFARADCVQQSLSTV